MRFRKLFVTNAKRLTSTVAIAPPRFLAFLAGILMLTAGSSAFCASDVVVPPEIQAIVDSPDRSDADRETDKRRHPAEMLAFFGVKP